MSVSRHLDDLAQAVGFSSPCDWRDEHDRLELYRAARAEACGGPEVTT
ncbi:hypothetical protein [Cellulomonas sp.]|nr:hypothetical protein [Cellulomonas sp.]MBO9556756.1 hypothetical protein [Cellulomonas sp.]